MKIFGIQNEREAVSSRVESVQDGGEKKFEKASRLFEEMMIGILVKEMWKTVPKGGMMPTSTGMDVAQEMYQKELAKEMSRAGGLGLSREIKEQFRKDFGREVFRPEKPFRIEDPGNLDTEA
ncbi:rod-binding protein [Leptospirillum ferriphilum]|jgi:flagellar protein FlgJ|uniref:rod-binding protein n=1 Tax=Leptospirillum ferriphilum TaxID=178606 RepID=UPI003EE7C828